MEYVNKLEKTVANWYTKAPHLPANGRKWLSMNIWWIALVGVIIGAVGVCMAVALTFFAGVIGTLYAGPFVAAVAGIALVAVILALAFAIVSLVLTAMAVAPLKTMKKRGWTLLFMVLLLHVASVVFDFLFGGLNLFVLIRDALMTAVGAYFLFEIRDSFGAQTKTVKASSEKAA